MDGSSRGLATQLGRGAGLDCSASEKLDNQNRRHVAKLQRCSGRYLDLIESDASCFEGASCVFARVVRAATTVAGAAAGALPAPRHALCELRTFCELRRSLSTPSHHIPMRGRNVVNVLSSI